MLVTYTTLITMKIMRNHEVTRNKHDGWQPIDPSIGYYEFVDILTRARVPLDDYGKGAAKTIQNLHREVVSGESVMQVNDTYELTRDVNVVWIDVVCSLSNGDVYLLREDRQEFKDGRVRRRSTPSSLGEKMQAGEDLDQAIIRALSEEIGVNAIDGLYKVSESKEKFTPPTFPGLETTYASHSYVAVLPEAAFIAEGYVEHQAEKDNYYVWDLLHRAIL